MPTPSVQLYSIRAEIEADLDTAIGRIGDLGFTRAEPYAFHLRTADYKRAFAATGLTAPTGHAAAIDSADADAIFDAAEELQIGTVIDPFVPRERWQTEDDVRRIADRVNELSGIAASRGLSFGYHNHEWEFTNRVDGRTVFEHFVDLIDPAVVLEVDAFWATVGGAQIVPVLTSLGDRVVAIHVKDGSLAAGVASTPSDGSSGVISAETRAAALDAQTAAGAGDLDIPAMLAAAPHALRVIEFDRYDGDIYEALGQSLSWLAANDPTPGA